jgi:hypothetical protein
MLGHRRSWRKWLAGRYQPSSGKSVRMATGLLRPKTSGTPVQKGLEKAGVEFIAENGGGAGVW